ncbi:MAG: VWA domain-containing protein [Verrucomicrobiae bacterium]|nr:VWA domain-containing protein [Verrucomicrobiae bacterium]
MDWLYPKILLLAIPALVLLFWFDALSTHPMSMRRRRWLLIVRTLLVLIALLCLASPARVLESRQQSAIFVLDHSRSEGEAGMKRVYEAARQVASKLPGDVTVGYVAAGSDAEVLSYPGGSEGRMPPEALRLDLLEKLGSRTNLSRAVRLSKGIFPSGSSRHVILVTDGEETSGSLAETAREAAVSGIKLHAVGVSGDPRPDVRVTRVVSSQSRLSEGASLDLTATVESSLSGQGRVRLFENGLEVDSRDLTVEPGQTQTFTFRRSPEKRNIYNYRVAVEGFEGKDAIPENNEALTIVDVRGKPLLLYVEGEPGEASHLVAAMDREGIRLDVRTPDGLPKTLRELAGYDGIILSDVPARDIEDGQMTAIRDYVDELGGGFVMIGGMNSFGVGGYYRTPIEEILPVKLKSPDQEESQSSAIALVIDRSGSMSGQKIEICKSASVAVTELLTSKDYIGVYAFDSQVHEVVPITKVSSVSAIAGQIAILSAGGGTDASVGMFAAREALNSVKAKIKHMIVLTDGQTSGSGYQALASQCHAEGITISTVAVGSGAQVGLLQTIAAAGGGQSYITMDPTAITRIFTQDTMVHTGRMIREEAFEPQLVEPNPMLRNWQQGAAPPLLGYVKTNRKATSQVPLVTDTGDPLLAHWRYGLGKVTAFTSDCKSRWAALWIQQWPGYSQMWSQILRETARAPQGQNMDLRLTEEGERVRVEVDLLKDSGTRWNDADVRADIFFVPSHSLGSAMRQIGTQALEQEGSGLYGGGFAPTDPGVYLVRAGSGAQTVSAGYVHNPSGEVATGQIAESTLREAAEITGGTYLADPGAPLELTGSDVSRYVELWPLLLKLFLVLFFIDIAIRRWENLMGLWDQVTAPFRRSATSSSKQGRPA